MEEIEKEEEKEVKKTEQQIIDNLFTELENYRQTNATWRSDLNDIYNSYIGNMDAVKKVPYLDPITIPKLRTEISYIVPYIFSGNPEIEIEGVGDEDKDIAKIYEKIVNYRLQTMKQAYEKIESWVKQATTFGTSIMRINWKFETEEKEEKGQDGEMQTYQTPILDEPELDVPNILDCFYNPILPDIYCQKSIIFRSVLPIEELKENPAYNYSGTQGLNRDRIKGKSMTTQDKYDSSSQVDSEGIDIKRASDGVVVVYERVTNDSIQTIVDGEERLLLRDTQVPYGIINAVKLIHEPNCIPNRFDGFGVGQNTLGLSKGYHSIVNQTKQNIALSNNTHFLVEKGAKIKKSQLVVMPGGMTEVDAQGRALSDAIVPLQIPDIKQGALEFMALLDDQHKRASGANDIVQGGTSNKTLGQDEMASNNSGNRFDLIQRRFKQALADVAEILIRLELENLQSPESAIMRIFPMEYRQTVYEALINSKDEIKYNIKVKGDTTIAKNKDVQIKQLIDWFGLVGQILPPENQMAVARKILELRGVDEIDTLAPDPQQYAQQQQQEQMMAQQAEMGMMPQGGQMTPAQQTYQM